MNEIEKYGEACFFLNKMLESRENFVHLSYYLSAFLSAARSMLQYAREEAKQKAGGQAWYDEKISTNPILQYFKNKRDVSIHERPVRPNINFIPSSADSFPKYDVDNLYLFLVTSPNFEEKIKFSDWTGEEDLFSVCQSYLTELVNFVREGQDKGFLTR